MLKYLKEVKNEVKKITWPGIKESAKNTVIVLVFSLLLGAYLGGIDFGLSRLLQLLLSVE